MTKFEEEVKPIATVEMKATSDGNEINFHCKTGLSDYLLSKGNADLYLKSQLQQQALPVVPECVGEWIECVKEKNNNALALLDDDNMPDDVNEWLFFQRNDDNINLILRAWLDGYQVEKPQLFYIALPKIYGLNDSIFVSKAESGIISEFTKGKDYALKLTEQEIKSLDERYWQFAVPVEVKE